MGYFKPLRRKIGVLTLVMACVFVGTWLRSEFRYDYLCFAIGDRTHVKAYTKYGTCKMVLVQNAVGLERFEFDRVSNSIAPFLRNTESRDYSRYEVQWIFRFGRFEIARIRDSMVTGEIWNFMEVSYLSIIIPLTLLSAWLLLGKIRNPKPTTEPDQPKA